MPRSSGASTSAQERDEVLVSVGDEVGAADDHNKADDGGARGKSHAPLPAPPIGLSDDPRNTDQDRHGAERTEVVDRVERGVDLLCEHHGAGRQGERSHQSDDEQSEAVGRCGLWLWDGRVEHAELFPLLALFHALGELSLLVALREGLIELAGTLVVTGELLELLFPPRYVLDPGLIGRDSVSE